MKRAEVHMTSEIERLAQLEKLREKERKLLEARENLQARIKAVETQLKKEEQKKETRRKILAGAAVLDEASRNLKFRAALETLMDRFLTKPSDRTLFGLGTKEGVEDASKAGSSPPNQERASKASEAPKAPMARDVPVEAPAASPPKPVGAVGAKG